MRHVSPDDHLTIELCESNTSRQQHGAKMLRVPANRGGFTTAVCMLSIALMCAMGVVQAIHSHSEDSTTSHHTCSICATAHAGISTVPIVSAPVLGATALAILTAEVSPIFRPVTTQFIRPPPAL